MNLDQLFATIVSAAPLAGLYVVIGLGWVVLFRATKILNFATGQFLMVGAYLFWVAEANLHLPFVVALVATLVAVGLLGAFVHIALMRPLAGQKGFGPVILTFGIATIIDSLVHVIFGGNTDSVSIPLPNVSVSITHTAAFTSGDLLVMGLAVVLLSATGLIVRYSRWGIQMRAAAEDSLLASQSGINIDRVFMLGWAFTLVVLTVIGIAWASLTVLTPDLENIGLNGLAPVIVGGMDSIAGVLPGAIVVALAENISALYFGESVRTAAVMVVVLVAIAIRPRGLFGSRSVTRV